MKKYILTLLILAISSLVFFTSSNPVLAQVCGSSSNGNCADGMFTGCPEGTVEIDDTGDNCGLLVECCAESDDATGGAGDGTGTGSSTGGDETTGGDPIPIPGTDITIPNVGLPDPAINNNPDGRSGIEVVLLSFLDWILIIFLIASIIAFVITGLMYLLSMGNSRSALMDNAKNYFTYAVIAVLITGSGLIIVNIVNDFLQGNL